MNKPHLHCCSVPGCGKVILNHLLMCGPHWRLVPSDRRKEVWTAWELYQDGNLSVEDLRMVQQRATDAVVRMIPKGGAA